MGSSKTFKSWVSEAAEIPAGTYAAVCASHNNEAALKKVLGGLRGTRPDKLHVTIAYSDVFVKPSIIQEVLDSWDNKEHEKVRAIEVRAFDNPSASMEGKPPVSALVLILDSPELIAMHQACNAFGCIYNHQDYYPHVSLMYGVATDEAKALLPAIQALLDAEEITVKLFDPFAEELKK
jgi:hypothetical protein